MARHGNRNESSTQTAPTTQVSPPDEVLESLLADEPEAPHAADLRAIEAAAGTEIRDLDGLKTVEAGRAALARLEAAFAGAMNAAKLHVAEFRQNLRVLKRRQYSAQHSGIFSTAPGTIYSKRTQPHHFGAILRAGKIGVDFEFVTE